MQLSLLCPDHLFLPGIPPRVRLGKHELATEHGLWRPSVATGRVSLAAYFISEPQFAYLKMEELVCLTEFF